MKTLLVVVLRFLVFQKVPITSLAVVFALVFIYPSAGYTSSSFDHSPGVATFNRVQVDISPLAPVMVIGPGEFALVRDWDSGLCRFDILRGGQWSVANTVIGHACGLSAMGTFSVAIESGESLSDFSGNLIPSLNSEEIGLLRCSNGLSDAETMYDLHQGKAILRGDDHIRIGTVSIDTNSASNAREMRLAFLRCAFPAVEGSNLYIPAERGLFVGRVDSGDQVGWSYQGFEPVGDLFTQGNWETYGTIVSAHGCVFGLLKVYQRAPATYSVTSTVDTTFVWRYEIESCKLEVSNPIAFSDACQIGSGLGDIVVVDYRQVGLTRSDAAAVMLIDPQSLVTRNLLYYFRMAPDAGGS